MDMKRSGTGTPEGKHGVTLTDRAVRMWGTPVARDDQKSPEAHMAMKAAMPGGARTEATSLTVQVKMWQSPMAADSSRASETMTRGEGNPKLQGQARMWPTPRAHDGMTTCDKASSHPKSGGDGLITAASRHAQTTTPDGNDGPPKADLNPRFVATLMGVPPDWLTLSISGVTDSSRSAQQKRSDSSTSGA
jgi:hypothetical protein